MTETIRKPKVSEVMVPNPIVAAPETKITEIAKLMSNHSIGSVIISKENKPIGIITERDLVKRILAESKTAENLIASDIMTKPVISVLEDTTIKDAIDLMQKNNIRRVVILNNNNNISGILTIDDIGYNIERYAEEIGIEYFLLSRKIRERKS